MPAVMRLRWLSAPTWIKTSLERRQPAAENLLPGVLDVITIEPGWEKACGAPNGWPAAALNALLASHVCILPRNNSLNSAPGKAPQTVMPPTVKPCAHTNIITMRRRTRVPTPNRCGSPGQA